jgi:hypothetical protein
LGGEFLAHVVKNGDEGGLCHGRQENMYVKVRYERIPNHYEVCGVLNIYKEDDNGI